MPEGKHFEHPSLDDVELTQVLFALSDPSRLAMVRQLTDEGALEVAHCGSGPKSTKSHHLKLLREAGVVRNEPHGRERLLTLRTDELEERFPGLLRSVLASTSSDHGRPLHNDD